MADDAHLLSPGMQQFIESMGQYFEQYNLPRIGGRILALLQLVDRPLTLDDMAQRLAVSRASISTNIRLIVASGLAEPISFSGDRRDYYHVTATTWDQTLVVGIDSIRAMQRIAERGLAALAPDDLAARSHLIEMIDFCEFALGEYQGMIQRWRDHQAQHKSSK